LPRRSATALKAFVENAYVNPVAGLLLFSISPLEAIRAIDEDEIGAHHGVMVFGLIKVSSAMPETLEGLAIDIEKCHVCGGSMKVIKTTVYQPCA
jgi:hypothetical protein